MSITLFSHGGAGEVTGAKHFLQTDLSTVMIDCGAFQGKRKEAEKAREAARSAFSAAGAAVQDKSAIPSIDLKKEELDKGINVMDLFAMTDLCSSKSEARRLITQGGASVNGKKITDINAAVDTSFVEEGELLLKAGKKRYFRVIVT